MQKGFKLIKAFQINDEFDWNSITEYEALCSYFLFDTASKGYGGSGKQFNWKILENYKGSTPFFLSGGIGIDDVDDILKLDHEKLFAVDLNSRFESEPGRKRIDLLDPFIKKLKS